MGVWQGVAMVSLKYHYGLPCLTLQHPAAVVSGMSSLQDGQRAAVFYPLGRPPSYAYV
jgi:hypothetical protein